MYFLFQIATQTQASFIHGGGKFGGFDGGKFGGFGLGGGKFGGFGLGGGKFGGFDGASLADSVLAAANSADLTEANSADLAGDSTLSTKIQM